VRRTTRRLGIGAAVLAATGVAVAAHAPAGCGGETRPAGIMPAAGGPIEELAIQFHREGSEPFLVAYEDLFAALRPATRVRVVVSDAEDRRVFERARSRWPGPGPRVRYVLTGHPITCWIRDRFAVVEEGDRSVLLAPPRPQAGARGRAHDWRVPWALRRDLGVSGRVRTAGFQLDGGDLIADARHVYVATPLFERNPDLRPEEVRAELAEVTGREVIHLGRGGLPVPDHHVGMFVTPLGRGRVLYGDAGAGLDALLSAGWITGDDVARGGATIGVGGAPLELDLSEARRRRFRNVGAELGRHGLEARPLPLVPARQAHVYLGYDNVLMERRADGLHVAMPVYGVPPLDRAAARAWESHRATVHPVRVGGLVRLGGTVRCLVAPLRRGES